MEVKVQKRKKRKYEQIKPKDFFECKPGTRQKSNVLVIESYRPGLPQEPRRWPRQHAGSDPKWSPGKNGVTEKETSGEWGESRPLKAIGQGTTESGRREGKGNDGNGGPQWWK